MNLVEWVCRRHRCDKSRGLEILRAELRSPWQRLIGCVSRPVAREHLKYLDTVVEDLGAATHPMDITDSLRFWRQRGPAGLLRNAFRVRTLRAALVFEKYRLR